MPHYNDKLADLLRGLDLGSSVAESDTLLQTARIETSAFTDLFNDRVDLIPGTKGSGKSALFRIFVDFLPDILLQQRKVVVAHGIQAPGDPVFHAFTDRFSMSRPLSKAIVNRSLRPNGTDPRFQRNHRRGTARRNC